MTQYKCVMCNFTSSLSANYKRHLNTKKHLRNDEILREATKKKNIFPSETLQNPPKWEKIPPKPSEIPPGSLQNPPKLEDNFGIIQKIDKKIIYICDNCGKEFSRKDNLKRHLDTRCKSQKTSDSDKVDYKEMFYLMKGELEKEKQEFKKQISILLEKVGNTTNHITNTQNIQLNSYGNEDLSHISESLKTKLIKMPFGMIPKMIEAVHFNDERPENKNIALTNKKDNKIMVFKNNKWVYCSKDETINDLVDGKYFILDNHYQQMENNDSFSEETKVTYEKFKSYFDEGDKKIVEQIKKDCELTLLNNR
jgi:hypothetical protein